MTHSIPIADPQDPIADTVYSTLLEIVENFEDPFELVRELLSNSEDAGARNVQVRFLRDEAGVITFVYEDDGEGLRSYSEDGQVRDKMDFFFKLGYSDKRGKQKIGRKGFGSKICLLCSRLDVATKYLDDTSSVVEKVAVVEKPYEKLTKRQKLVAEVSSTASGILSTTGTRISITRFEATTENFFKSKLLIEYIRWFTAGGTVLPALRVGVTPMRVSVTDWTGNTESFTGQHNPPDECDPAKLDPTAFLEADKQTIDGTEVLLRSRHFAKRVSFPNTKFEFVLDGSIVCTVEVAAWILGRAKKDEFASDQLKPDRDRFGVWLAQHGILVQRNYSWITSSPLDCNYHVVVNCDQFELNADRTRIKGKNNVLTRKVKAVFDEHFKSHILDAHKAYKALREEEDNQVGLLTTRKTNKDRMLGLSGRDSWPFANVPVGLAYIPENEIETCGVLCALAARPDLKVPFRLVTLSPSGTDAIVSVSDTPTGTDVVTLYEVEYRLSSFLRHGHSPELANGIICWENDLNPKAMRQTRDGRYARYNTVEKSLEVFPRKLTGAELKSPPIAPDKRIPVTILSDVCIVLDAGATGS